MNKAVKVTACKSPMYPRYVSVYGADCCVVPMINVIVVGQPGLSRDVMIIINDLTIANYNQ